MPAQIPVIWFKSNKDPQTSFAGSLWIAIHTQIYNYTHVNDYIMRINNIVKALSYSDYFGFLMDSKTLSNLSALINKNLRKMKIKEFYFSLTEDNDVQKAINYMEKGRPLVIGIPYYSIDPFVKYGVVNNNIPENIKYYLTAFNYGDQILLIPSFQGVELKTGLDDFYNSNSEVVQTMGIEEFVGHCGKIKNGIEVIYANVLAKNGEEVRSLNEY